MSLTLEQLTKILKLTGGSTATRTVEGDGLDVAYYTEEFNDSGEIRFTSQHEMRFDISRYFENIIRGEEQDKHSTMITKLWLGGTFLQNTSSRLISDIDFSTEEIYVEYTHYNQVERLVHFEKGMDLSAPREVSKKHLRLYSEMGTSNIKREFFPSINSFMVHLITLKDSLGEDYKIEVKYLLVFERGINFSLDLIEPKLLRRLQNAPYNKIFNIVEKGFKYNKNGYWFS